jgi:fatty-acyl-CoA synthase
MDRSISSVVQGHAADDDGREFLRLIFDGQPDKVLSYSELVDAGDGWARRYAAAGVRSGDRVLIVMPHGTSLYCAFVGAILFGAIPVLHSFPSPKMSEDVYFSSLREIVLASKASLLVTSDSIAKIIANRTSDLGLGGIGWLTPGGDDTPGEPLDLPTTGPFDEVLVQFSSGTTGIRKGVSITNRELLAQIQAYGEEIRLTRNDRILTWLPLYHDMGLIACLMMPLVYRTPIVAMSPFEWVARPVMWLEAATQHRCTLSWFPNFAYSFLASRIDDRDVAAADLSALRGVVNCSEPVRADSMRRFLDRFAVSGLTERALAVSYAMAENTFAVTSGGFGKPIVIDAIDGTTFEREHRAVPSPLDLDSTRVLVGSGRPLRDVEVEIRTSTGSVVPERFVGEIGIRSPYLFRGYERSGSRTEELDASGWFMTGDLGYVADGEVFVTGRVKDLIIVGGVNIYPQDLEEVLANVEETIPGRIAMFGVEDTNLGTQRVVVMCESESHDELDNAELANRIRAAVASASEVVISDVMVVAPRTLLKSSSGKLSRSKNRELYLAMKSDIPEAEDIEDGASDIVLGVRNAVRRAVGLSTQFDDDTALITSGLIDSFGLAAFLTDLEAVAGVRIAVESVGGSDALDSVRATLVTLRRLMADTGGAIPSTAVNGIPPEMRSATGVMPHGRASSRLRTWIARCRLRSAVIGRGFAVAGPILLELSDPTALEIGDHVHLMPSIHLKTRDGGRIVLGAGSRLDTGVRIVAANNATVELGENVVLGIGTVINAGADVTIGAESFAGPHVVINASDHGIVLGESMLQQRYTHEPIVIGSDVWLGAGVCVTRGSQVGNGAVLSAGSVVTGRTPANAVVQGQPARVIKMRSY